MLTLEAAVLRKPEPDDVPQLYEYRNDEEVTSGLGGFSTGYSKRDMLNWVERHDSRTDEVVYVIADRETMRCLGHVGLYNIDSRVRSAEFAILIGDKQQWGRGLGQQVSRLLIEYGFRQLNLHRVYLKVLVTNERGIRLYERLGFRREGVLRDDQFRNGRYVDVVVMGLLESEL